MKRASAKRRIGRAASLLALALIGAGGAAAFWVRRSLPAYDGDVRVDGPRATLRIVRDRHAIPHVFAENEADAYFGLGFAHAQDRLFQLELNRRVATGTLAELVGEDALEMDRLFRTLGLAKVADDVIAGLDARTREALEAYARGVNAYLDGDPVLPPEFLLLGAKPARFTPRDSALFVKLLAWQLSGNWSEELWRLRLSARLSPAQLTEFLPPQAGDAPLPFAQLMGTYRQLDLAPSAPHTRGPHAGAVLAQLSSAATKLAHLAPSRHGEAVGSNNWAVDGARTASGKPLLANDPHLALSAPSQWYFAHLEAPGLSVAGATLPALPGVILGHNQRVAWAFTNTHPDSEDVFIERLAPGDESRYLTPDGPASFVRTREVIKVRGGTDVEHWVRRTRHGPVISDVSPEAKGLLPDGYVLALSWVGLRADDETLAFPLRASHAENAEGLREAARSFHNPTQNLVFADVAGAIGFVAAGRVPVRKPENALRGLMPAPGWLADYDWTRLVPFEALPQTARPASGRIVTANQNVTPPAYPGWLGADWGPPYRHDRIATLLDAQPAHTLESFAAIQRDQQSTLADRLVPALLAALGTPRDDAEREVVATLSGWDRGMHADRRAPLLFAAWQRALSRAVYADELGALFDEEPAGRPEFLEAVLANREGQGRWCDRADTARTEDCTSIAREALHEALAYLDTRLGTDRAAWTWGAAHPSIAAHPVLGPVPVLGPWFDVRAPRGGDGSTVDVGSYLVGDAETAFENDWGPGFRALYDLSNLERSLAILNTGQSGNVLSPHYRDMNASWVAGAYVSLRTDRKAIEASALGTLTLRPAAR
ncbi:MAG: penicillin acylase family protein [Polyangiales bacterium]